jgi:predicted dehydrogenase
VRWPAPHYPRRVSTSQQAPIRWGILGPGNIARTFVEDLLLLDDHTVAAVGSRDLPRAQAFAAQYGIGRPYGSYADLAADDSLDVVYVATPHSGHYGAARLCLLAGRAVLVEKPFTVTAAHTADLIALARDRHLFAMEAMWTRFNPLVREVADRVRDGAIGEVTAAEIDCAGAREYDPESRLWSAELAGGALLDLGVYPISFGAMLLGEPDEVHAVAALAPTGVDENTAVIARYPGGAVGLYHCGLRAGSPQAATIVGTGGIITVGSPFYRPERYTLQRTGAEPETTTATLTGHGFVYEAQEVARCLRAGLPESPVLPLDQTLAVMRTLDAARAETDAGGAAPA